MAGIFLQLSRVLPDEYPLPGSVASYLDDELGFGRLLDYGVIVPRLQQLYEWSADELGAPASTVHDGALTYAWAFEDRDVWRPPSSPDPGGAPGASTPTKGPAMSDDAAADKRRRLQWVQRHLVNPPAKAAVWCGLVPGL